MQTVYTFQLPQLDTKTNMEDKPESPAAREAGINRVTTATSRLFVDQNEAVYIFDFNNLVDWPKFLSAILLRWRSKLAFLVETENIHNNTNDSTSDQTFGMYRVGMMDNGNLAPQDEQVIRRVIFVINREDDRLFKRAFTETLLSTDPNLVPEWTAYINETDGTTLQVNTTTGALDKLETAPVKRSEIGKPQP